MDTAVSEIVWVEGIGPIGQYYSYLDSYWEKNVPYFVRDMYITLLNKKPELIHDINFLNSKIQAYETMTMISTTPIKVHRQNAKRYSTPPPGAGALPMPPTADHSSSAPSQPSLDPQEPATTKKPVSRKRKATPASSA